MAGKLCIFHQGVWKLNRTRPIDNHVHTCWSLDIPSGPKFEDYIPLVERERIDINFLDHLEVALFHENVPLKEGTINKYLEAFDLARSRCAHLSVGFEVDYYPDKEAEIAQFLDSYRKDVDLIVGAVHEIAPLQPITVPVHLRNLLKSKSFNELINKYFECERKMVESGLFDAIAHPDVIFRFCGDIVENQTSYANHPFLLELGDMCKQRNIRVELNVRGLLYPCRRSFPDIPVVDTFLKNGVQMFVGSDSHSVEDLQRQIQWIKQANSFIDGKIKSLKWAPR